MSMAAESDIRYWLKQGRTAEEIQTKIRSLEEHQEWAFRNMVPGMDGCSRSINWSATQISILKAHLEAMIVQGA